MRWAWAEVDLEAIAHNVRVVKDIVDPADVWVSVKADGYGHGAVEVALTALEAGAAGLCVALVQEGVEFREAGIDAPILVLSEQPPEELADLVINGLIATVYSQEAVAALAAAVERCAIGEPVAVHLKIDTGMHRVGASPDDAVAIARAIDASPWLTFDGVFTHLAVADEPDAPSNALQLSRFDAAQEQLAAAGLEPRLIHAANSAAAMVIEASRFDFVRLGIAMYGIEPGAGVRRLANDLRPALSLRARVSLVKRVSAGEGVSYGLRHTFDSDTTVATLPIGYGDGVPRRLFEQGGDVLLHGCRRPIVGVVTMDQLMVDCGELPVAVGDEAVLLGTQTGPMGQGEIRAEEWATRLGTIGYEIVCGISKRIERRHFTTGTSPDLLE